MVTRAAALATELTGFLAGGGRLRRDVGEDLTGWPKREPAWLPSPHWEPPDAWPTVPNLWDLWQRDVPRLRALPRDPYELPPLWTTHLEDFKEIEL